MEGGCENVTESLLVTVDNPVHLLITYGLMRVIYLLSPSIRTEKEHEPDLAKKGKSYISQTVVSEIKMKALIFRYIIYSTHTYPENCRALTFFKILTFFFFPLDIPSQAP